MGYSVEIKVLDAGHGVSSEVKIYLDGKLIHFSPMVTSFARQLKAVLENGVCVVATASVGILPVAYIDEELAKEAARERASKSWVERIPIKWNENMELEVPEGEGADVPE